MAETYQKKYISWMHAAMIVVAVLLAYFKIFDAGFISWDDADYVANNKDIQNFSVDNLSRWFSSFYIGNYHPLTMLSYAIDHMFWGAAPGGYHITNILLHIANALLLYAFAKSVQANIWVAFFVAILFAVHPVQTESVSWVAERKNVLYGFFFLSSLWLYTRYVAEERIGYLLLVIVAGVAAMLSKAAAVTLPLTLIAVDIWLHRPLRKAKVWLEKLPLLAAAVVLGLVAISAQKSGAFLAHHDTTAWNAIVYAGYAYVQYIIHLLVPVKLSVLYPYPASPGAIHYLFLLLALGIVTTGVIAYKRKWYLLSGGILFYTVNIAIVLQFVQFGEVLMADRYLYIACIGVWLPLTYLLFDVLAKRGKQVIAIASAAIISVLFLFTTFNRNEIWQSELQFWEAIVETHPQSAVAQNSLGGVYMVQGRYNEALKYIDEAIKLDGNNYKAWYNKGVLHLRKGELSEAEAALNRSVNINQYTKALFSRALLYQQAGQPLRALNDIEIVLQQEPYNARAHFIKGNCLEQTGSLETAISSYNKAVEYGNNEPLFYLRRGILKIRLGDYRGAIHDCSLVIERNPQNAEAWYWRGMAKHEARQMPCHDLNRARNLGYQPAQEALMKYCNKDQ